MHPKCQKKGHRFQARYDEKPNIVMIEMLGGVFNKAEEQGKYINGKSNTHLKTPSSSFKLRIYVHDICVRCGEVVRREGEQT